MSSRTDFYSLFHQQLWNYRIKIKKAEFWLIKFFLFENSWVERVFGLFSKLFENVQVSPCTGKSTPGKTSILSWGSQFCLIWGMGLSDALMQVPTYLFIIHLIPYFGIPNSLSSSPSTIIFLTNFQLIVTIFHFKNPIRWGRCNDDPKYELITKNIWCRKWIRRATFRFL